MVFSHTSRRRSLTKALRPITVLAVAVASCIGASSVALEAKSKSKFPSHRRAMRFDVAMNGASFFFQGPVNPAGYPANGTPFIVSGYLYPHGTFATHGAGSGTNPDGSPEFPDLVVGTWYCRGWHLQDGDALTGPVVATTQIFDLDPDEPGKHTIVTDGIELADFGVPFKRAIVGGSGRFSRARGQSSQVYVDFNASLGFNTSFVLRVKR